MHCTCIRMNHTVPLRWRRAIFLHVNWRVSEDSCWNIRWQRVTHAASVSGSVWANGWETQAKTHRQCSPTAILIIAVESGHGHSLLFVTYIIGHMLRSLVWMETACWKGFSEHWTIEGNENTPVVWRWAESPDQPNLTTHTKDQAQNLE